MLIFAQSFYKERFYEAVWTCRPFRGLRNTRTSRRDILLVNETVIRMKETNVTFWNYAFSSGD